MRLCEVRPTQEFFNVCRSKLLIRHGPGRDREFQNVQCLLGRNLAVTDFIQTSRGQTSMPYRRKSQRSVPAQVLWNRVRFVRRAVLNAREAVSDVRQN